MANDPLMTFLTNKHGTGIETRADAAGNHALAQQTIDAYAQNGQVVPPEIAKQLQELNDITQREVMLSKASGSARAALSGTGYDPVAVRNRAADLEMSVINGSAIARNATAAAELQIKQQQAKALELQNGLTAATFNDSVNYALSDFQLRAAQNYDAITALEDGKLVKTAIDTAYATGASLADMYTVFAANDPAQMKAMFGTSDRRVAHGVLRVMQLETSEMDTARFAGMQQAVQIQAMQLANDPAMTNDVLLQMQSGALALPENVTRMAVDSAVAERMLQQTNANALKQAESQGITNQQEYNKLVLSTLTSSNISEILAGTLSAAGMPVDAAQVMEAFSTGNIADVASAVMQATNGGKDMVTFPTITGQQVQMPVTALLETMSAQLEAKQIQTSQLIVQQSQFNRYMQEARENERVAASTEGMLGVTIPGELKVQMQGMQKAAETLYLQASRATTPEERTMYEQEAMRLMDDSREQLVRYAKAKGVPEAYLEDIRQGRFSSDETFGSALVSALDPGTQRSPLVQSFNDLVRRKGVTTEELREFAKNPTVDNFDKFSDSWLGGPKISMKEVVSLVDGTAFQVLSSAAIREIDSNPAFDRLPAPALNTISDALNSIGQQIGNGDMAPGDAFMALMPALRIADEMAYNADMQAYKNGQIEAPSYQRGTIMKALAEGLNNQNVFAEYLAPGGKTDRATAALLTLYTAAKVGGSTSGPNAMATADLATNAANYMAKTLQYQFTGNQYSTIDKPMRVVSREASLALLNLPEYQGYEIGARAMGGKSASESPEFLADLAATTQAVQSFYLKKLANPSMDASTIPGTDTQLYSLGSGALGITGRPSRTWFGNAIATNEDIVAELRALGNTDLANRIEAANKVQ